MNQPRKIQLVGIDGGYDKGAVAIITICDGVCGFSAASLNEFDPKNIKPSETMYERIYAKICIAEAFRNEIARNLIPDADLFIAIEGYAYGKYFKSHDMGEIGGLIRKNIIELLWRRNHNQETYHFYEFTPMAWKKLALGKGSAKKEQIQEWAQGLVNEVKSEKSTILSKYPNRKGGLDWRIDPDKCDALGVVWALGVQLELLTRKTQIKADFKSGAEPQKPKKHRKPRQISLIE